MQHRASLVSNETNDEIDILLDLNAERIEMFVDQTSVGRWPLDSFIASPDGSQGFHLDVDGEHWVVRLRDHPLFLADALPRTPWTSRARLVNRYPRAARIAQHLANREWRRAMLWGILPGAVAAGAFGLGALVGRYRADGGNLFTWTLIVTLGIVSVIVARIARDRVNRLRRPVPVPPATPPEAPAVSRLLSTLEFRTAGAARAKKAEEDEPLAWIRRLPTQPRPPDGADLQTSPNGHAPHDDVAGMTGSEPEEPAEPAETADDSAGTSSRVWVLSFTPEPDDLTEVQGIGPAYARMLAELGITTFAGLASIDQATLRKLRSRMGNLAGRITRERWIEQAAELHAATLQWASTVEE